MNYGDIWRKYKEGTLDDKLIEAGLKGANETGLHETHIHWQQAFCRSVKDCILGKS